MNILVVYSGIILGIRYIYQFMPQIFDDDNDNSMSYPFIGLEIYDTNSLYTKTASDTILLVASILAHRSNKN